MSIAYKSNTHRFINGKLTFSPTAGASGSATISVRLSDGQRTNNALTRSFTPPAMTVEADVTGRRYREDRDTVAVVEGSKEREVEFTERWTMVLDGDAAAPWRIAEAGAGLAPRAAR